MARRRNKITLKPTLFIACEGTSSEYQYFESWAQTDLALSVFQRVNVYPDEREERPKTTPFQLYELAKKELESGAADYCWIVIDRDNHPKMEETFKGASECGVRIAFSARSFEEWILLHFEKSTFAFQATECKSERNKPFNCGTNAVPNCSPVECLTGHIRRKQFISDYSKKKDFDLFSRIQNRLQIAIINSAWQRFKKNAFVNAAQHAIYNINPYTNVDQLILQLHGKDELIEWGEADKLVKLNDWSIMASCSDDQIILKIQHCRPQPVALSSVFELSTFFTSDDSHIDTLCQVLNKSCLTEENGSNNNILYSGDIVQYTLQSNNQPYFIFKTDNGKTRIFLEL